MNQRFVLEFGHTVVLDGARKLEHIAAIAAGIHEKVLVALARERFEHAFDGVTPAEYVCCLGWRELGYRRRQRLEYLVAHGVRPSMP